MLRWQVNFDQEEEENVVSTMKKQEDESVDEFNDSTDGDWYM